MSDIFISYKREDKKQAELLARKLEASGWSVWWDHDLLGGDDYDLVIEKELKSAKCVIVIWSALSVLSRNVKDEAKISLNRNILVPVSFNNTEPPIGFGMTHVLFFENSNSVKDNEYARLYESVVKKAGEPGTPQIISDPPRPQKNKKLWIALGSIAVVLIIYLIISGLNNNRTVTTDYYETDYYEKDTIGKNDNYTMSVTTETSGSMQTEELPQGNNIVEEKSEREMAKDFFKNMGTEMIEPFLLDTISYFRIKNITDNSATLEIDYVYNSRHGDAVYLGGWLWKINDKNISSGYGPVRLASFIGKAEITISLSDLKKAVSSEGFIVFMSEQYKAPFTARIFKYKHDWKPVLNTAAPNIN